MGQRELKAHLEYTAAKCKARGDLAAVDAEGAALLREMGFEPHDYGFAVDGERGFVMKGGGFMLCSLAPMHTAGELESTCSMCGKPIWHSKPPPSPETLLVCQPCDYAVLEARSH